MLQPFVIAKTTDSNQYLSSGFPRSWEVAKVTTWVSCGAWKNEVLTFDDHEEATRFAAEFTGKTGVDVEVVAKWPESIDEILDVVGVNGNQFYDPKRLRAVIAELWLMLPTYPRMDKKVPHESKHR